MYIRKKVGEFPPQDFSAPGQYLEEGDQAVMRRLPQEDPDYRSEWVKLDVAKLIQLQRKTDQQEIMPMFCRWLKGIDPPGSHSNEHYLPEFRNRNYTTYPFSKNREFVQDKWEKNERHRMLWWRLLQYGPDPQNFNELLFYFKYVVLSRLGMDDLKKINPSHFDFLYFNNKMMQTPFYSFWNAPPPASQSSSTTSSLFPESEHEGSLYDEPQTDPGTDDPNPSDVYVENGDEDLDLPDISATPGGKDVDQRELEATKLYPDKTVVKEGEEESSDVIPPLPSDISTVIISEKDPTKPLPDAENMSRTSDLARGTTVPEVSPIEGMQTTASQILTPETEPSTASIPSTEPSTSTSTEPSTTSSSIQTTHQSEEQKEPPIFPELQSEYISDPDISEIHEEEPEEPEELEDSTKAKAFFQIKVAPDRQKLYVYAFESAKDNTQSFIYHMKNIQSRLPNTGFGTMKKTRTRNIKFAEGVKTLPKILKWMVDNQKHSKHEVNRASDYLVSTYGITCLNIREWQNSIQKKEMPNPAIFNFQEF